MFASHLKAAGWLVSKNCVSTLPSYVVSTSHLHPLGMQTPQRSRYSRGRGSAKGGSGGPGRTSRLRGLFDGIWHCDCDPRLPAEQFKVKKEGPNKGRDFYTCQQNDPKGCAFFLWAEDARPREAAVVLTNGRKEIGEVQEGWSAGRRPVAVAGTVEYAAGVKRSSQQAGLEEEEDDDDEYGLTREDEEELAQVADTSVFQTPRKPQSNMGVYATPSSEGAAAGKQRKPRKLPWVQDPITPVSAKKNINDYFGTPSKQQIEPDATTVTVIATSPELPTTPASREDVALAEPPSPSPAARFKDSLAHSTEDTLTKEVFQELGSIQVPKTTVERLRAILTKHDLRTQGVKMGRDFSRSALKAKEAKIVELEERIKMLEEEERPKKQESRHGADAVQQQQQDEEDGEETDVEL